MATSCPACGGPLTIVNTGCSTGRETKTIVQCAQPNHGQWLIYCRITPLAEQAGYRGAPHVATNQEVA